MDRRDFLMSALATAGSAQSAIVLGGMRQLQQFAGPQNTTVVPGGMVFRWFEPMALALRDDPRYSPFLFEDCYLTHFNVQDLPRPVIIPVMHKDLRQFGPSDVRIAIELYGCRNILTPPAQ